MGEVTDFIFTGLSNLGSQYIQARYAAPQYVVQGKTPGAGIVGGNGGTQMAGIVDSAGMAYDCGTGPPPPDNCGPKAVYKYSCGAYRWVYPKRRRRKQLLSNSDAAGLAKLKGLLGVGKTMDTWIATHS